MTPAARRRLVEISTSCLGGKHDVCGNEETFYPPLSKVMGAYPVFTDVATYTGSGLGTTWQIAGKRSAFLATFAADAKAGDTATISADVMWLVCSDVCVPEETHLTLPLTIGETAPPADAKTSALFSEARSKLPHASPWKAVYDAGDKRFAVRIESPELVSAKPRDVAFYPYADGYVEAAARKSIDTRARSAVAVARNCPLVLTNWHAVMRHAQQYRL